MKIGFIGNITNSMYLSAKSFRSVGYDAHYYHLPSNFMFSQPFWEHKKYFVAYNQLNDKKKIYKLRQEWLKPEWMSEPPPFGKVRRGVVNLFYASRYLTHHHLINPQVLSEIVRQLYPFFYHELRTCDWVMATGVTALLACQQANVPCVFWPHGGDLRDAAGAKEFLHHEPNIRIVANAVRGALLSGSHGSNMIRLLQTLCDKDKVVTLPLIINTDIYQPKQIEADFPFLPEEINGLLRERKRTILFMSSRFSDRWKGTDLFISAFLDAARKFPDKLFLITSGWGDDYLKYRDIIAADEIARHSIYCLEGALSKAYLRQLINCVDVVVDQFVLGWYGASFLEAAALGKMSLIYLNREKWDEYIDGMTFPPVRDCQTQEQLVSILGDLAQGKIDTEEEGRNMLAWARENHGMERWVPRVVELVENALSKE